MGRVVQLGANVTVDPDTATGVVVSRETTQIGVQTVETRVVVTLHTTGGPLARWRFLDEDEARAWRDTVVSKIWGV